MSCRRSVLPKGKGREVLALVVRVKVTLALLVGDNMKKTIVMVACLMAGAAFAVAQAVGSVSRVNDPRPQLFLSGFFTGSDAKNPLSTTKNKQAYHLCGTLDYDFPALGGTGAALDTVCADSASLTLTGCGFNDRLSMGIDQTKVSAFGQISAYVSAANTVKVTACGQGITDGGSFNQPDSGYTVCCDGY